MTSLKCHVGSLTKLSAQIAEWTPAGDSPATRLNLTDEEDEANKNLQYGIFPDLVKIVVVLVSAL